MLFFPRLLLINVLDRHPFNIWQQSMVFSTARASIILLEDDNHCDLTFADTVLNSPPHQIRQLFAI